MSSIFDAIKTGDLPGLETLLSDDPAQASARESGVSALLTALYHHEPEAAAIIEAALRAAGSGLDGFEAAATGDVDRLRDVLAEDPAFVKAWSADGFTALHLACFFDQPRACTLLLDAGASTEVAASNPSGVYPIHSAAAARSATIIRLLLAHGAVVDTVQHGGWTALMAAAKSGDAESVTVLLAAGGNPGKPSEDGSTARDLADSSVTDLLG